VGGEIFRTCPDRPWGPRSLLYNGYRVFLGGKERPGRDADPSLPSNAVVMKGYSYTPTPPIGRTACTEPQCLYKGALYRTACTEPQCLYKSALYRTASTEPQCVYKGALYRTASTEPQCLYKGALYRAACTEPQCLYKGALYVYFMWYRGAQKTVTLDS
jgi:hypothetical protein